MYYNCDQSKAITKINVVLLNYFEDRGQQKRFLMNPSCFILKKKEVLPVTIYLRDCKKQVFFFEIVILYLSLGITICHLCQIIFSRRSALYCEQFLMPLGSFWKHLKMVMHIPVHG